MKSSQYLLWSALGLAVCLGLVWQFYPLSDATERLGLLPERGFGFKGTTLEITEVERKVFEDVNLLKRFYRVGRLAFFMTVLDGTHNRNAVHDPSYCFQGSGWSELGRETIPVQNGYVEVITLGKEGKEREVALWFSNGRERYASVMRYWFDATLRRLTLGYSGNEPVRIILQPAESTHLDWEGLFVDFHPLWEI